MPDQTRTDWIPRELQALGTLVLISEQEGIPSLIDITRQFSSETFRTTDEDLTKFYFSEVPYSFVTEYVAALAAYSYVWIPEGIRNFFKGICRGEDCTASQSCVRPGCVCKQSLLSKKWKCR